MIWARSAGAPDGPLAVLLHGLGATAEVYAGLERLLEDEWPGGWLTVDLAGHGRSGRAASYTFAAHADLLAPLLPFDRDLVLVGHSLGGLVALELAPRLPRARAVVAFSTKTRWPADQVAGMQALARKPPRRFATREQAAEQYLKQAGLTGLVKPTAPAVDAGLVAVDVAEDGGEGGWQVAQDPATNDFGTPDPATQLAAVTCPVTLACGSLDPFVRREDLAELVPSPVVLPGLGHNPHVEDPHAIAGLLAAYA